jgi:hypothetical protein
MSAKTEKDRVEEYRGQEKRSREDAETITDDPLLRRQLFQIAGEYDQLAA